MTFKTGKDTPAWDQSQARTYDAICRHTALTALAQLRTAAIRAALTGAVTLPAAGQDTARAASQSTVATLTCSSTLTARRCPARAARAHTRRNNT